MGQEATIAARISELARERTPLRGSWLGTVLRAEFPTVDFRQTYGGLRSFIAQHCQDIAWLEKHGQDDLYVTRDRVEQGEIRAERPVAPWQAFTNPSNGAQVAIDAEGKEVVVVMPGQDHPANLRIVPKATVEEYRAIAKGFLVRVPTEDREAFATSIDARDFWQNWMNLLNTRGDRTLNSDWRTHRLAELKLLWRRKLGALGINDDTADELYERMRSDRSRFFSTAKMPNNAGMLREAVLAVVAKMSDDDLRKLWLPVGSLIDVLKSRV